MLQGQQMFEPTEDQVTALRLIKLVNRQQKPVYINDGTMTSVVKSLSQFKTCEQIGAKSVKPQMTEEQIKQAELITTSLEMALKALNEAGTESGRVYQTLLIKHCHGKTILDPLGSDMDLAERRRQVDHGMRALEALTAWARAITDTRRAAPTRFADPWLFLVLDDLVEILTGLDVVVPRYEHAPAVAFLHTAIGWVRPKIAVNQITGYLRATRSGGSKKVSGVRWSEVENHAPEKPLG